jgi:hypothetical protein
MDDDERDLHIWGHAPPPKDQGWEAVFLLLAGLLIVSGLFIIIGRVVTE